MKNAVLIAFGSIIITSYCNPYEIAGALPLAIEIQKTKGISGNNYLLINKKNASIQFEIKRPDLNDESIVLCIAAAFTTLNNNQIDGLYIHNGISHNKNSINKRLGGAAKITGGNLKIFPTEKGALLNDSLIKQIESVKGSLFQQIQMIHNGIAASFKDIKLFQRRGIAVFKDGLIAVVESESPVTLKTFADDLVGMGCNDLLYTDMGAWDEGWYRNPGNDKITIIGNDRSQTNRQSNWIIFKKN